MWSEWLYSGTVKVRFLLQGCLLLVAVGGCVKQAIISASEHIESPEQSQAALSLHSPAELRDAVQNGHLQSMKALFVGKNQAFVESFGLQKHQGARETKVYSYAFAGGIAGAVDAIEILVRDGVVSGVDLYRYPQR